MREAAHLRGSSFMILYPILLSLRDAGCVIVGGGAVARRKVVHLIEAGARLKIVAPAAVEPIRRLAREGRLEWIKKAYGPDMLEGNPRLVFACTDRREVNARVAADARALGIAVSLADDGEHSDFHLPSMVRRGSLLLTVSTAGEAPALSREICHRLEQQFGPAWGEFTSMIGELRRRWAASGEGARTHERVLELLASDTLEVLQTEGPRAARRHASKLLRRRESADKRGVSRGAPSGRRAKKDPAR